MLGTTAIVAEIAMGLSFSSLFSSLAWWSKDKDVRILMLGLDSAGKVYPSVSYLLTMVN